MMKELQKENKLQYVCHHCQKIIDGNSKDPKIKTQSRVELAKDGSTGAVKQL